MNDKMKINFSRRLTGGLLLSLAAFAATLSSCNNGQSYSELLREEEHAVNAFLATQRVENNLPADSISFETGENAPFYRLDEEGYLYMQVIRIGEPVERPEAGDLVYFRYTRENLKYRYLGYDRYTGGNQNTLLNDKNVSSSFVYKNRYLESTTSWGEGIQWPMKFFGYDSEVNLVLSSYYGFTDDMTYCNPYLINIKYFKPEY